MTRPTEDRHRTVTLQETFAEAARWVDGLVTSIGSEEWTGPGLGGWDLRGLVGHTSRAFLTLETALDQPAEAVELDSPEDYFAAILSRPGVDETVLERGIAAGARLGDAPAEAFSRMCASALRKLGAANLDEPITTVGGGMRAGDYVRTRTFELVVHGTDIATARGVDTALPDNALRDSLAIAVELCVRGEEGSHVLSALTGRTGLTKAFTVLG